MKKIFISYSHKDTEFKDKLVKQLGVLHLAGLCSIWEDGQIPTGTDWNQGIEKAIAEADVAVLMVSEGFLKSKFINETEIPLILKRKDKGELTVLPLFVKPCQWKSVPWLAKIQGFPAGGSALSEGIELEQLGILTQFAGTIASYVKISPSPTAMLFTQLPPRKIKLIGREKDLDALGEMLKKSERVVLVNGLGGIGKTEVCKSFFYTHYNQYVYAAWIDWISTLKESLVYALGGDDSEFIQVGEKENIDERFKKIMTRLRQTRESFLLVVDNIENPQDADLDALASLPNQVKVLVNSRSFIEGYQVQCLDYLSPGECRALFYEFYQGKRADEDDETVDRIVELCGYHTLTVELLAKTAHHAGMKIQSLYETLKSRGFNLNEVAGEKIPTFWHNEKEKKRFFDHLVKVFDISGVTKKELSVLVNMSVLPSVYIPMEWIREWLQLKDNNPVASLVEKGWLKRDEEARLYLHPVMQEVVRYRAKPDAQKCKTLIISLANKLNLEPGDNPILKKEYILYGESVVRALAMEAEEKDEDLATLANNLSTIYQDMGQLDRALEFQLKALAIKEAVLDKNHPSLATSYNNVSMIYQDMGQLDRALEFQLKALAIREAVLDKNHPSLAQSYHNLSYNYQDMNDNATALAYAEKAVAILQFNFPNGHPNLDVMKGNLENIKKVRR